MPEHLPVIGFSCGDINGIGPEIVIKALANKAFTELCTPVVFASGKLIAYYRKNLVGYDFSYVPMRQDKISAGKVNLVNCWEEEVKIEPGKENEIGALYALKSLETARRYLSENKIHALVTAPISKKTMARTGWGVSGHTEYLGQHFGATPLMLMVWEKLRVATVTGHVPLSAVAELLTVDRVANVVRLLDRSLRQDFGVMRPTIAVLGLNPHASDGGLIGQEEAKILEPALELLTNEGYLVAGPFSPDGFWASLRYRDFDAVVAMYHDQGLIPFKLLAGHEGVNYTAGLPVVRTSPDHGPAFDRAGQSAANESSLRAATYLAIDILRHRASFREATANPLPLSRRDKDQESANEATDELPDTIQASS